ncbi:DNA translocase FtsK [Oceanicella actignis]|uniref:DNA translocase FtsK n=1 Tax=Oceanicella actignis TaxID=1189325 RepID=A0A1M7T9B1_9RHOB|nr:DNA translocase FtsK [Oceanicella actignis]SET50712.1 DNA translocase FtsK [Oceanicella actignis]SHN67315.1 DNA segregation ATPase FtsK/SpoIIIE, S-DNA-T family [Oceanicella actignis]
MTALIDPDRDDDVIESSFLPPAAARALRRRLIELAGAGLFAAGLATAAMLGSYDPADPSFFNVGAEAPRNLLGAPGAYLADPLARFLGWAAWGLAAALLVWGVRLALHRGEWRIWSRLGLFAPLAVVVGAAFASLHAPPEGWPHPYGLGGWIGDALAGGLLRLAPLDAGTALLALTPALGAATLGLGGVALGLDGDETRALGRWMGAGLGAAARLAGRALARAGLALGRRLRRALTRPRSQRLEPPAAVGAARQAEPTLRAGAAAASGASEAPEAADAPDASAEGDERQSASLAARLAAAAFRRANAREDGEADADPAPDPAQTAPAPRVERARKSAAVSRKARAEAEPRLPLDPDAEPEGYQPPPLSLLQNPREIVRNQVSDEALEENARMLETVLDDYGIRGEIVRVSPGPVVTMYELEPAPGLKASRVIGLADDIARSMSALSARVSTVPGRSIIGIELPNERREKVLLREIFESRAFGDAKDGLLLALGKSISGEAVVTNLARMPHLLIAGTTGSGKSVAINTMILSLLYRLSPKQCRMIMIDPKMLELSVYDGIPHLLSPVVTDPKKAVVALKWVVAEMEERYRKMSRMGVRNIEGYNARVRDALARGEPFTRTIQTGFDEDTGEPIFETQEYEPEELPFIVVIVDEMADLMMVAGKEIEACIQRLAQMARASGIHLIMATQRPSVDVITGTIKANFPTRISFQVTSKIDSRTILGEQGAEQLLGMGDMLYMAGGGRITRVHGPFVSDEEVEEIVNHLKAQGEPEYVGGVTEGPDEEAAADIDLVLGLGGESAGDDQLYDQAVAIVARDRKCSTSYIQRKLAIGYNKAARLVEQMEAQGVVSPANKVGKREILIGEV